MESSITIGLDTPVLKTTHDVAVEHIIQMKDQISGMRVYYVNAHNQATPDNKNIYTERIVDTQEAFTQFTAIEPKDNNSQTDKVYIREQFKVSPKETQVDCNEFSAKKTNIKTQTNKPEIKSTSVTCELLTIADFELQNEKFLQVVNENENLLQTLLFYKRENDQLKIQIEAMKYHENADLFPESTIDTLYNESIKEADTDEELENDAKSTVLFKRASLDDTPIPKTKEKNIGFGEAAEITKKKRVANKTNTINVTKPAKEDRPTPKKLSYTPEESKSSLPNLHTKLYTITTPSFKNPELKPQKPLLNSSFSQPKIPKVQTPKSLAVLSKSVLSQNLNDLSTAKRKGGKKIIKRRKVPQVDSSQYNTERKVTKRLDKENKVYPTSARKVNREDRFSDEEQELPMSARPLEPHPYQKSPRCDADLD